MSNKIPINNNEILLLAQCYELILSLDSIILADSDEEDPVGNLDQELGKEAFDEILNSNH